MTITVDEREAVRVEHRQRAQPAAAQFLQRELIRLNEVVGTSEDEVTDAARAHDPVTLRIALARDVAHAAAIPPRDARDGIRVLEATEHATGAIEHERRAVLERPAGLQRNDPRRNRPR